MAPCIISTSFPPNITFFETNFQFLLPALVFSVTPDPVRYYCYPQNLHYILRFIFAVPCSFETIQKSSVLSWLPSTLYSVWKLFCLYWKGIHTFNLRLGCYVDQLHIEGMHNKKVNWVRCKHMWTLLKHLCFYTRMSFQVSGIWKLCLATNILQRESAMAEIHENVYIECVKCNWNS